ncbi:hypothetical protein [Tellurirhabdus rosea]|uniref:hypothetical protein n=1 Tax=Tellurirhabdus rosea TaxID=2674997 RepID=UPI00225A56D8|nr:hypothetical protein [Tellurirhabdus rosea]
MKEAITRYFLPGVVLLAVVFAVAMKATVFQKEPAAAVPSSGEPPKAFAGYWFAGKAELNRYRLEQAQYGALNPGEAVLIFVTEDFRTDTQVKSETEASRSRSTPVLKLNFVRKFVTGIYDYSLYTSVFTPIQHAEFPATLKVSTSGQEWCGHSYLQMNYRSGGYGVSGRSYFEQEVAEDYEIGKALLEDEIWNRIRLAPDRLPTGSVSVVPGTQSARLRHRKLEPLTADVSLTDYTGTAFSGNSPKAYRLEYKTDGRTLLIVFENQFPHRILGWEETYKSKDKQLTSRAVLQKTVQTDYWNRNAPADTVLRL